MSELNLINLVQKTILSEHVCLDLKAQEIALDVSVIEKKFLFANDSNKICLDLDLKDDLISMQTGYYVGIDWLIPNQWVVHIPPKVDKADKQTDYLSMLFTCMKDKEIARYIKRLCDINFSKPDIEVDSRDDLLTPFLVAQFMNLMRVIVQKGLKKSYYKVEKNLVNKAKGKILVSKTLNTNFVKQRKNKIFCEYEEFGINNLENRVLKKALIFAQSYLKQFPLNVQEMAGIFNFVSPAFELVDDDVDIATIKNVKTNTFFKEYPEAINLAKLILRRFGYNLQNIEGLKHSYRVPPFWIDMPLLFELYVYRLLKSKFGDAVQYQVTGKRNQPDFLIVTEHQKFILDAKYKTIYTDDFVNDDIRQLSGYARDIKILRKLGVAENFLDQTIIDCIIIYIDQEAPAEIPNDLRVTPIEHFVKFYKVPISIPTV